MAETDSMYSRASLITQLVASSVAISKLACKRIVQVVGTDLEQKIKYGDKTDLQTKADRVSQQIIVNSLRQKFGSKLTVIGEEDGLIDENLTDEMEIGHDAFVLAEDSKCPEELRRIDMEQITVWVDPLDGTTEFTQGLFDHVTVLIGIAAGTRPVAGIIAQPFFNYDQKSADFGRTIWAIKGMGVFGLKSALPPMGKLVITTTRSHSNKVISDAIEALKPTEVIRVGGAGHKVLLLAEGRAHAYVFASKGCKKWDTCAPEAVLTALGGKLTDLHNDFLNYDKHVDKPNSRGVFATAPTVDHETLIERIPKDVKDLFL